MIVPGIDVCIVEVARIDKRVVEYIDQQLAYGPYIFVYHEVPLVNIVYAVTDTTHPTGPAVGPQKRDRLASP